jgi:hypothetical protein
LFNYNIFFVPLPAENLTQWQNKMIRKVVASVVFFVCCIVTLNTNAQTVEESCSIIESDIVDNQYHSFTLSGDGYLSYVWTDKKGSETTISIDLTQITISKDVSNTDYKVWINCIDGSNCVIERGIVGDDEQFYGEYSKTYLSAKDAEGMDAIYLQLEYLLKLSNGIR